MNLEPPASQDWSQHYLSSGMFIFALGIMFRRLPGIIFLMSHRSLNEPLPQLIVSAERIGGNFIVAAGLVVLVFGVVAKVRLNRRP